MAEIKFSPESIYDLKEIKKYISDDLCNEIAASATVTGIVNRIKELSAFPLIGASLSPVVKIETDYRYVVHKNYMVFFRYENSTVFIVRVLYGKRNYIETLFGELPKEN